MKKSHKKCRLIMPGLLLALVTNFALADFHIQTKLANLHSGPAVNYGVTATAHAGETLTVKGFEAGYVQVILPNGKTGWVHAASQGWKQSDILAALKGNSTTNISASPATPTKAAPQKPPAAAGNFSLALADMGYRQGHYFEGAYGVHSKAFYFPLPQDANLSQGTLRVYFRASPLLNAASSLRLDINGKPARLLNLENREQASYVDIPLDREDMQRDALRLTVKAVLSNGEGRCLDERRLALHYVQILPQTALTVALNPATSLAAAWTSLPAQVAVGMPQTPSASSSAALLQTAIWLRGMGRQVNFVPYPQTADVMIGSESELTRRYSGTLPQGSAQNGVLALTHDAAGKPLILVSDQVLARPLAPQPLFWAGLLRGDRYRTGQAITPVRNTQVVDLIAAGLGETQYVSRSIDWNIDLSSPQTPADKQLQRLVLNVVAAPQPETGQQLLQVFLNGMLQEIRPLDRDGKPHTLRFDLDRSLQRAGLNQLRIAVQRTDEQGDCRGNLTAFPVQLLPGSRVDLVDAKITPVRFNDLRAHFAQGMDVYLTPDAQSGLTRELQLAASIFSNLGLNVAKDRVHFLKSGEVFAPKQPFVLIGRGLNPDKAAVRLDRGRVQVLDGTNQVLLALDHLPGIGLAQLISQGNVQGLAIQAPLEGAMPAIENLHLDRDNVAFISGQGIALTLDSREPAVSKVDYPDYGGWRDWFAQHRFWLIALGWTLIGATMVGVYRKTRKHAKD